MRAAFPTFADRSDPQPARLEDGASDPVKLSPALLDLAHRLMDAAATQTARDAVTIHAVRAELAAQAALTLAQAEARLGDRVLLTQASAAAGIGPRGSRRWIRVTATMECRNAAPVRPFGLKQNITEEKLRSDRTRYRAEFDVLTGLANRATFQSRPSGLRETGTLLLVDRDGFKGIEGYAWSRGRRCLPSGRGATPRPVGRRTSFSIQTRPRIPKRPRVIGIAGPDQTVVRRGANYSDL